MCRSLPSGLRLCWRARALYLYLRLDLAAGAQRSLHVVARVGRRDANGGLVVVVDCGVDRDDDKRRANADGVQGARLCV